MCVAIFIRRIPADPHPLVKITRVYTEVWCYCYQIHLLQSLPVVSILTLSMGDDQCQNLQLCFGTVLLALNAEITFGWSILTVIVSFEWWNSISKCSYTHLNGEILYPNGHYSFEWWNSISKWTLLIWMVKFCIQMDSSHLKGEFLYPKYYVNINFMLGWYHVTTIFVGFHCISLFPDWPLSIWQVTLSPFQVHYFLGLISERMNQEFLSEKHPSMKTLRTNCTGLLATAKRGASQTSAPVSINGNPTRCHGGKPCANAVINADAASDISTYTVKYLQVTMYDKVVLLSGDQLKDKHIHAANTILHQKFPQVSGLQNTLLWQAQVLCPS